MEKSIYELICNNINDGVLKDGFSLPEEVDPASVRFAPGALDGIRIYHMGHSKPDADGMMQMEEAVRCAAGDNRQEAEALFAESTKMNRAISVIDELQNFVMAHSEELDANHVFNTALFMVLHSHHTECVKLGLELLELFRITEESIKGVIRRLGLYDEFTIFAVWNMREWDNSNEEFFGLAKNVHGWGRIHAIERLRPETAEIRYWLLTEGTVNNVANAYSALSCWRKSGAEEVLSGNPSAEEYQGLSTLIAGLLDEGPVTGVSALDNAEEILRRFIEISPEYDLSIDSYETILSIYIWAEEKGGSASSISAAAGRIIHSRVCTDAVQEALKNGEGIWLAQQLNIPVDPALLDRFRNM